MNLKYKNIEYSLAKRKFVKFSQKIIKKEKPYFLDRV